MWLVSELVELGKFAGMVKVSVVEQDCGFYFYILNRQDVHRVHSRAERRAAGRRMGQGEDQ